VADGQLPEIRFGRLAGGEAQAALDGAREPVLDDPEAILRGDGGQSGIVAQNLADVVLADQRE